MTVKKIKTNDHRKVYPEIYKLKEGPPKVVELPSMKYINQPMITSYNMNWAGTPQPIDEQWLAWKIVNRLKNMSKTHLEYKFKLMPHEVVWLKKVEEEKWKVSQMMQIPDFITEEMFEEAKAHVEKKNIKGKLPEMELLTISPKKSILMLHKEHYKNSYKTLEEIKRFAEQQGLNISKKHREIYLTFAMETIPVEKWRTVIMVDLEEQ